MATRYVTKHGSASDSNGGTNATTDAWATAIKGFSSISGGDTLKFGTGTYDVDRSSVYTPIPSGSSGSPTIITDNADGQVTFHHPGSGFAGIIFFGYPTSSGAVRSPTPQYISFIGTSTDSIKFDGENVDHGFCVYHGWNLVNNIVWRNILFTRFPGGAIGGYRSTDCIFDQCTFHANVSVEDVDVPQAHALYTAGNGLQVTGCVFSNNTGWGLHCYSSYGSNFSNQYVVGNIAYGNGFGVRSGSTGAGLLVNEGSGIIANNVCYENSGPGIQVWRAHDILIAHNTCHNNGLGGIEVGRPTGTTSNITIKNNICIGNGTVPIRLYASCTGTVATWNRLGVSESLDTSGDSGGTYNNNVADAVAIQAESGGYSGEWTDPENATLASRDYSLVAAAKSIWNASTNDVPTVGIATDIAGTSRVHPDQGAYAFGTPDPPDPPVIGHLTNYPVTAWTLRDIALTLFDNDSNTKNLTFDGSTDGVSIEFGDTTNCTVT